MRSELEGCPEEEDTVVNILRCSNCGAEVRVYHNNQTEEESNMEQVPIGIKNVGENSRIPEYKTARSSGADVYSADEDFTLRPGERRMVHTGVYLQILDGYEVQVRSRSGLAAKHGIVVLNSPGTIDSDYQGECNVILANQGDQPWVCRKGERIAQFVLAPVCRMLLQTMIDFSETTGRGEGGFGSTGMK